MSSQHNAREQKRLLLQAELDSHKSQSERNKFGQFATPTQLARDVMAFGLHLLKNREGVRFFDPAVGTGAFYSALLSTCRKRPVIWAKGFEIDAHYGKPAQTFWSDQSLEIILGDFTRQPRPHDETKQANLLICNPPYVRHHHLIGLEKLRLRKKASEVAHIELSGLSGLYCYFIALAHDWMSTDGIAGWLIPSEFMDVNYGRALKSYLLHEVTLLHIHRFDPNDVQFDDSLVSSAVVWFKKSKPSTEYEVTFSYGGTMQKPALSKKVNTRNLEAARKWTLFPAQDAHISYNGFRLSDLFMVKRGLATGDNKFFILDEEKAHALKLPTQFLRPILPNIRHIKSNEIKADEEGMPLLEKRLFLIDCDLPEDEVKRKHPQLWAYLQAGMDHVSQRYLCRSRKRWYTQERRPAAPIVCTYIGRSDHDGQPFRFLLNGSKATATNVYLCLYPQPQFAERLKHNPQVLYLLWKALNKIKTKTLLDNGRVYGGGMHKLEPSELANVPADELAEIIGLSKSRK